jgi:hypothetical protein
MTTFSPRSTATRAVALLGSFVVSALLLGATVVGMQPADDPGLMQLALQAVAARTTGNP